MSKRLQLFLSALAFTSLGAVIFFVFQGEPIGTGQAIVPETQSATVLPGVVIALTNSDRVKNGSLLLVENPLLTKAAQMKVDDMLARQYYSHVTPEGRTPLYFLDAVGYKYLNVGENLDLTYVSTAEDVETAWMNSPEHRSNILLPQFTEVGIGVAEGEYQGETVTFVAEIFATPLPQSSAHPVTETPIVAVPLQPRVVHTEVQVSTSTPQEPRTPSSTIFIEKPSTAFISTTTMAVQPILNSILAHVASSSLPLSIVQVTGTSSTFKNISLQSVQIPFDVGSVTTLYDTAIRPALALVGAVVQAFIMSAFKLIHH